MASLKAASPIAARNYQGQAISLGESLEYGFIQVKARNLPEGALSKIGKDAAPLTYEGRIVWIGPHERLLLDDRESGELLARCESDPLPGCFVRSASSGLIAIKITGASTRRMIENETSVVQFKPGFAARLRFADLAVVILVRAEDEALCLVERSAASWLFDWLENRATTLGL